MWWHSATTSERRFWIITEKTIGDIVRLQLSEVFDWLVEKNWSHSEFTSERGFLKKYWKDWRHSEATAMRGLSLVSEKKMYEDILRLQISKNSACIVKKIMWRRSATTSERGFWLNTEKD